MSRYENQDFLGSTAYQKGMCVAFFSASVYYSLNFQQLVVVVHPLRRSLAPKIARVDPQGTLYITGEKCVAKLLRLDVAQLTDVGRKREHNEDNMAYVIPKDPMVMMHKGSLFIVADGMGGHAAGEVASEIAVDTVSNTYYQDDSDDVPATLLNSIRRANAAIHQRAAENMLRSGMGTTCVAAVLRGGMAYVANVGDSRAYLIRKSRIRQVSQDHSWVAEQVRAGLLTEEQARTHAQRNVITRSLGTQPDVEIDLFREVLEDGDTLLLCSDGLSGFVTDEELMRTVDQFVPQESVYHLIERANESGGPDNITAIVARVQELGVDPPGVRQPVPVGGPELSNEDTARLFAPSVSSGMSMPSRNGELAVPGSPFPYTSGPLVSSEHTTASQTARRTRKPRGRLFYPTLVLVLLFLLGVIGSGAYYFLHVRQSQSIAQTLDQANQLIDQAQTQTSANPVLALQDLSRAQQQLRSLNGSPLTASDSTRITSLQNQLINETKTAITNYNMAAKISSVPCANTTPGTVDNGTSGTAAQSIALIQGNHNTLLYYALGQDGKVYQLTSNNSQYTLTGVSLSIPNTQLITLTGSNTPGANGKIFALGEQMTNNTVTGYTIELLTPSAQNALGATKTQTIGTTLLPTGYAPTLLAAWQNNVYVVLSSKANPNSITILSYSVDTKNNTFGTPTATQQISVTENVVGITATSSQVFLLLSDGQVLSLDVHSGQELSTPPTSVLISTPIAAPLATGSDGFSSHSTVPTAATTPQRGSSSLTVPMSSTSNLTTINAVQVQTGNQVSLFIGDPANHRVLNLTLVPPASSGGPGGATPTATLNTANSTTFTLFQQYVLPNTFSQIKGVAADPGGTNINILGQEASNSENLVTVGVGTQQACAS